MNGTTTRTRTIDLPRTAAMTGGSLWSSLLAELLVLRKRSAYWILLAFWTAVGTTFGYIVPYLQWRNSPDTAQASFTALIPERLVGNVTGGFPFYGGAFVLILGVLSVGSDYTWDTLKTLLTQRPGRLSLFAVKMLALAVALVPFVLSIYTTGAIASAAIAAGEDVGSGWPSIGLLAQGMLASWFILAVWTSFGVMLAVLSRGTSMAVGIGILYALAIEGLLSALASQISLLDRLVELFIRANAYSLVQAFDAVADRDGPGAFSGPFVSTGQAVLVLTVYLIAFLIIAAITLRRRDVDG